MGTSIDYDENLLENKIQGRERPKGKRGWTEDLMFFTEIPTFPTPVLIILTPTACETSRDPDVQIQYTTSGG